MFLICLTVMHEAEIQLDLHKPRLLLSYRLLFFACLSSLPPPISPNSNFFLNIINVSLKLTATEKLKMKKAYHIMLIEDPTNRNSPA